MIIDIYKNQVKLMVGVEARKASLLQIDSEHPEERVEASLGAEYSDDAWFSHQCRQGVDMLASELHKFIEVEENPEVEATTEETEMGTNAANDEETVAGTDPSIGEETSTDSEPLIVEEEESEEEEEPYGDNQESTSTQAGVTSIWRLKLTLGTRRRVWPNLMASSFERFLVYYVLTSWAAMNFPNLVERYTGLRNEALEEIKRTIYRKELPTL